MSQFGLLEVAVIAILISAVFSIPGTIIVMRIPHSGAYKDMEETISSLQARYTGALTRLDDMDARIQWQSTALMNVRRELEVWVRGGNMLYNQVIDARLTPVWHPPARERYFLSPSQLRQIIAEAFTMEEQADLAFDLGIREESLTGQTLGSRARALVSHAERNDIYQELERRVVELRPHHPLLATDEKVEG